LDTREKGRKSDNIVTDLYPRKVGGGGVRILESEGEGWVVTSASCDHVGIKVHGFGVSLDMVTLVIERYATNFTNRPGHIGIIPCNVFAGTPG
jgi:hypothetical protein